MCKPVFVEIKGELFNLAHICNVQQDEAIISVYSASHDAWQLTFDSEDEATAAFQYLISVLQANYLLLINQPPSLS